MYSPRLTLPEFQPLDISIYVVFEFRVGLARDQQLQQFFLFLGFLFLRHNHKRRIPTLRERVHVCVCVCVCVCARARARVRVQRVPCVRRMDGLTLGITGASYMCM